MFNEMVIITCFVFSFSMCYIDISFFLSIIHVLLSQFHFVARKIAVTLRQISFSVCQRVVIV